MQKSSSQGREALNARTFTLQLTGRQAAGGFAESSSHCIGKCFYFFTFNSCCLSLLTKEILIIY